MSLNAATKMNLVLKHGKKFAEKRKARPALRGIHYAGDGSVYATNAHYALRIKNAHEYSDPLTADAWTGEEINDAFPNIENVFPTSFEGSIAFNSFDAIQDAVKRTKWPHDITKALKTWNRLIQLTIDQKAMHLELNTNNVYLKNTFSDAVIEAEPFSLGLNAEYLYNTLKLFEDAGTHELRIKLAEDKRSPVTFEDERNEIAVIILPVVNRHNS